MKPVTACCVGLAVAASLWATVAAVRMGAWLSHHGVKVNWFLFRMLMPWYADRYKKMTTERDGRPGPLYPQFLVTINVALVAAVAAIVTIAMFGR